MEYVSIKKSFLMRMFFCEKIEADITVSRNFQNYLNFLPTLQLQLRNISQLKDNVHEKRNIRCRAKCLTGEISDFTPCVNAQNIILLMADKSDD